MQTGKYELNFKEKTYIMGILNVTPDSFSDGGKFYENTSAIEHAKEMVAHGADIIDIGGESTRPGFAPVSAKEEINRVTPIIQHLAPTIDVPLSIDTYKAETANAAIEAGAHIINDIWGAKKDPEIADVAAQHHVPIILTHNREKIDYESFIRDSLFDLYESITICKKRGVQDDQIILDPGIGFGKTYEQNVEMMQNLDLLVGLGYPVLLGTSRKSMIGYALDLPVSERMEGTGATICYGIMKGCQIIRVHDVKEMARIAKMMDILINGVKSSVN
ncbi:dihydropteroate synthase [Caldibacillus thermoamylovorans]|uniref:dihydropteroate synthase n=1 Tax=Caldibacillus thermoamylovorans TaxID=35841 RepID=UPI00203F626A|nr:dihydropteroate synthase [Caldibacillus thermoamylovorans]MCM3798848.1 dihydropteroate synthase [Caldibacillus thermoamylovorans]